MKMENNMTTDQHVLDAVRAEKVLVARQRHGKPFAFEKGSNWAPRAVPVLTEWMQHRTKEEKK
tara:strand:- start:821 stop:1009 length:189 start_codon:yes stop_codon:yes gene_type:complete